MNEKPQFANLTNIALVLATVLWGAFVWRGNMDAGRPVAPGVATISRPRPHRVGSRLWEDPFEAFESATNQTAPPNAGWTSSEIRISLTNLPGSVDLAPMTAAPSPLDNVPWTEISNRITSNDHVSVFGVMMEGGPYAEDREVRLRIRYAVEMALLDCEMGAEDNSHICTNDVDLGSNTSPPSHFAYEWFRDSDRLTNTCCVLWLDEYDFADHPVARLKALLSHIPYLDNASKRISFYLIGPRASDTLSALVRATNELKTAQTLRAAAQANHFHLLSTEATATAADTDASDVAMTFSNCLGRAIFHNWISTERQLSELIANELKNRLWGPIRNSNNVIAIIAEQDTFYGRQLADDWIGSITNRGLAREDNIWQFGYFRGLNGSKPATEKSPEAPASAEAQPGAAVQKVLEQQRRGEKADGDAQLDYVARLGEFLQAKDHDLKRSSNGTNRVIAVGLTGSDPYDKLYLLRQLRSRLPEAVFFTTDLDAPLWTSDQLKWTQNLLVASGYPVEPDVYQNSSPNMQEFPPFRDVYQAAIFRACVKAITYELHPVTNEALLDGRPCELRGSLYKIGRHGPIELTQPDYRAGFGMELHGRPAWRQFLSSSKEFLQWARAWCAFAWVQDWFDGIVSSLLAGVIGLCLAYGFRAWPRPEPEPPKTTAEAERQERERDVRQGAFILSALLGAVYWSFVQCTLGISQQPGEETANWRSGASIWPTEWIQFGAFLLAILFLIRSYRRHIIHRRKIWRLYFSNVDPDTITWEKYWNEHKGPWFPVISALFRLCRERRKQSKRAQQETNPQAAPTPQPNNGNQGAQPAAVATLWGIWTQAFNEHIGIMRWMPPFVQSANGRPAVDAAELFRGYVRLGLWHRRLCGAVAGAVVLFGIWWSIGRMESNTTPDLLIRGLYSHWISFCLFAWVAGFVLLALAYTTDATWVTWRFLDCITRHCTVWPAWLLKKKSAERGVEFRHLAGWLDVDFAAMQTKETAMLMFGPFLVLLLLVISRGSYFDSWTWPGALLIGIGLGLACLAQFWFITRRAANEVRAFALEHLDSAIKEVAASPRHHFQVPALNNGRQTTAGISKKSYLQRLQSLRREVMEERRGAYAPWYQDPTYLSLFIPTGVTGIVTLVAQLWLNR